MSFFAPLMLFGLIAAAVPVILHLLRRRTADRVDWGAWMFLVETMRRKRRKLMLEDLLLLLLRTLILALAAFAFARPFLPEFHFFGGRGMDKDVVIVLDTSASMRLKDASGVSAFDRAIAEIRELIDLSPRGTAFGLVAGDSTPEILTATPLTSRREILDLLDAITPGEGTMDAPRTLAAAGEVLAAGSNPAKEVVVYGDGQAYGWQPDAPSEWKRVERAFARFIRRPPVVWRALSHPAHVRNAAIAKVEPSRRIVGTDRPVGFTVTIVNSGSEAFSPGDAVITVDDVETARRPVGQILPGLSRTFEFPVAFTNAGPHRLVAALSELDDLPGDSVVTNTIEVIGSLDVLLVNGRAGTAGFDRPTALIEAALRPEVAGTNGVFLVRPRTVRPSELEDAGLFREVAATVLCDVPLLSIGAQTNLANWVRGGGGLLTVAGPKCRADFSTNEFFVASWTNWNGRLTDVTFKGAPVAGRLEFDESQLAKGLEVLERFSDGAAATVAGPVGKGRSAILALPMELDWTMLPARPAFVPFIHELVADVAATNSFASAEEMRWRAREGDLAGLTSKEADAVSVSIDLGYARSRDDALAAIVGRSFGLEFGSSVAVAALVLLILELLFCRRLDRERGGRVPSKLRFALRVVAVLAIVWMLSHVSWIHETSRPLHRRVAVFTDASLSMQRADPGPDGSTNAVTRYETATNLAARIEAEIARRYDVEPFEFGGETTDFAAALDAALDRIPSEELAGAVFITDGRSTEETSPEAAARRFARLGAKISSIIVGCETNRADAAVESVRVPENVFLGDKVRPVVRVRADAMKGRKLGVSLMEGDETIERREFQIEAEEWEQELSFVHDPQEKGVRSYRIVLTCPEGDLEPSNDVWPFNVSVSDDRTNVLLADGRPRWEFRYLRNLFYGRDKSVHLQYLLTRPDRYLDAPPTMAPAADATRAFGEAEAGRLPRTLDDWRKFDVIFLGDLGPEVLTEEVCAALRTCVEDRGAMLVVTAGPQRMPAGLIHSPFAELLPVVCTNEQGVATAEWKTGRTAFALTPSGRHHPITALAGSASETERIWQALPPARARLAGITPKTGAEVLLFAADSTPIAAPLMTVRQLGRGKVVFFATDETWLLRYRTGDTYHHRFWSNVLRWGAGEKLRDGNRHARVGTTRLSTRPGEPVRLCVRLRDRELLPISGAKPVAEIVKPDGTRATIELVSKDGAAGTYEADFADTEQEGRYSVVITDPATAQLLGPDWPAPLETFFTIDRTVAPVEYARLSADRRLVAELARLTGGTVFDEAGIDGLNAAFGGEKGEIVERVEDPIWNHPLALALFALALIATWLLRKRKGLA